MLEFLVWCVVPTTVAILITSFFILRSRAKRAELKLKLEIEAGNAIRVLNSRWGQFQKELSELGTRLRLEKDARFIKQLEIQAFGLLAMLREKLEHLAHYSLSHYNIAINLIGQIVAGNKKPCPHILAEVYKRIAEYEKAMQEATRQIQTVKQHLRACEAELEKYTDSGYQLGPDRHFATPLALIREAEKIMATDPPDPEKAIEFCKEAAGLADQFAGRINYWVMAHREAKIQLEHIRELEHHLRKRHAPACGELDLLQCEYPVEIWYPLDIAFGGNRILDQLGELALKRFEAMDKMDMKVQDFEGAVVLLGEIEEELKKLEEVIEKPFKTRAELRASEAVQL